MKTATSFIALFVLLLTSGILLAPECVGQIRIIAFGDSTTAERDTVDAVYAQRLPALLVERGVFATVRNAGKGGDTTAGARQRFARDVLAHAPDWVILQFGLNDSCIDVHKGKTEPRLALPRYENNLRYLVTTLRHRGVQVILMTPNAMRWTDDLEARFGKPRDHSTFSASNTIPCRSTVIRVTRPASSS